MDRSWYWKAGFIVAVTIFAVYALVPSYTSMPASGDDHARADDPLAESIRSRDFLRQRRRR